MFPQASYVPLVPILPHLSPLSLQSGTLRKPLFPDTALATSPPAVSLPFKRVNQDDAVDRSEEISSMTCLRLLSAPSCQFLCTLGTSDLSSQKTCRVSTSIHLQRIDRTRSRCAGCRSTISSEKTSMDVGMINLVLKWSLLMDRIQQRLSARRRSPQTTAQRVWIKQFSMGPRLGR